MTSPSPAPRRHLMVPGQPPRHTRPGMTLGTVQKWVLSTLAASTLLHMAGGLVLAARYVDRTSSQVGLLVISGAFGVLAMAAALLIHRKRLLHPLLLLGLTPPMAGAWWVFG